MVSLEILPQGWKWCPSRHAACLSLQMNAKGTKKGPVKGRQCLNFNECSAGWAMKCHYPCISIGSPKRQRVLSFWRSSHYSVGAFLWSRTVGPGRISKIPVSCVSKASPSPRLLAGRRMRRILPDLSLQTERSSVAALGCTRRNAFARLESCSLFSSFRSLQMRMFAACLNFWKKRSESRAHRARVRAPTGTTASLSNMTARDEPDGIATGRMIPKKGKRRPTVPARNTGWRSMQLVCSSEEKVHLLRLTSAQHLSNSRPCRKNCWRISKPEVSKFCARF